ncbi:polyketide synthase dehydratase domain-containing protein, partial [Streptomyces sp. NPDC058793]|uniref:polyketide synthase dehydratase domain-containing protein n=1 Tax=Streptomyces sp. NPDC058793 TaxID=3346635 RepID=UPI00367D12A4
TKLLTTHHTLIEISPHPVLTPALTDTAHTHTTDPTHICITHTLHRDHDDHHTFHTALAHLHTHHHTITWPTTTGRSGPRKRPKLPTYAFQRRSYWLTPARTAAGSAAAVGQTAASHPLLGAVLDLPDERATVFTGRISLATHPWLADHAVHETTLLPATAITDLALYAGAHLGCPHIDDLTLHAPVVLSDDASLDLCLLVTEPDSTGRRELTVHTRSTDQDAQDDHHDQDDQDDQDEWTHHATATLTPHTPEKTDPDTTTAPTAWPPYEATALDTHTLYDDLATHGYHYGPHFQGLTAAWHHDNHIYAEVTLPTDTTQPTDTHRHTIHPALLDAALHPLALHPDQTTTTHTGIPHTLEGITLHTPTPDTPTTLRVRLT